MEQTPKFSQDTVLGQKVTDVRRQLDTFELPAGVTDVSYTSDEVTSNCPITGQPDFYEVTINLISAHLGLESKSLKLYLQSFREDGQFCEQFAATIAGDVSVAVGTGEVYVTVVQKPRGGVSINAEAYASQKGI